MINYTDPKEQFTPGVASRVLELVDIQRGDLIIPVCRVSSLDQYKNQNLRDQERSLCRLVKSHMATVVEVFKREVTGYDPNWLIPAVELAKKHNAYLLAETTDRYIRHPLWHPHLRPHLRAGEAQLEQLRIIFDGVRATTVKHPDAPLGGEDGTRSYHIKRGIEEKANTPTYDPKALRHEKKELFSFVVSLRLQGCSLGSIAKLTGIKKATIQKWIERSLNIREID